MGFDRIISRFEEEDSVKFISKPSANVTREFKHKKGSSALYVIILPWHIESWEYYLLKKEILKDWGSYAVYKFSSNILSSYPKTAKKCYESIRKAVRLDLENLAKKYGFSKIVIIGISLGCVNACMIANNNKLVNKIILVVPGHCLAESLWTGSRTRRLRQAFEKKGITLKMLKKAWKNLAPENNISGLKGKDIYVYLSHADEAIPYYCGSKLAHSMRQKGLNPHIKTNKYFGHYLSVLRFLFFPKKFLV